MSIIGQEIENYAANQIKARQKLHGSGTSSARTPQQISVLNSNTSWVKLASGVKIDKSKLTELGLPTSLDGMELAKNNVLFGGTSKLVNGQKLQQKEGFLPYQSNSSYTYGDFGYTPMPGIISADIKALTRGSLKKATVKFKVHNKQQFDIVDVLYMRLGYTVLLEWGNSMYTSNGTNRQLVQQTIIEDSVRFFSSGYESGKSYRDMLPVIEFYRNKYEGNYDGLLGKVSNFNWSFQSDGSYDIEITIISLGDVVESLKTNISSNKQLSAFIENTLAANPSGSGEEGNNLVEENADSNDIAAMLYCWKYVNKDKLAYESYEDSIYIKRPDDTGDRFVGAFLETSTSITTTSVTYRFAYIAYGYDTEIYPDFSSDPYYKPVEISYDISNYPNHEEEAIKEAKAKSDKLTTDGKTPLSFVNPDGDRDYKRVLAGYESLGSKKTTIDSPLTNFNKKDACFINTEPDKQFYLRFGALLTYLKNNIIPKVNTSNPKYNNKPPIFSINTNVYGTGNLGNYMYSLPNQISLDPRVCIVRNDKFQTTSGITEVYKHLSPFRAEDYAENPNPNKAYIMNIYLNFNFIIECINNNLDEKGDIGVFGFLKAICDGLNKSLGGINNLEPIIKEESNTLYIIDTTPIPGLKSNKNDYTLQLFGYNASTSNFVRNVDLKTAITPEYATMITVGATAGGYVKGTEATAFSKWNNGLKDRFQEEFIPGNENSAKEGDEDEAASNYTNKFLSAKAGSASRYGFKGNLVSDDAKNLQIDPGAIEKNISVVTEYYKYLIASQKNQQGGTVGFIPFKLNFSMDGISGIKIYNKLHVDTRFLPKAYGNELDLIVTGVSHKLSNDDWETDIETTLIPKTNELKDLVITAEAIVEAIESGSSGGGGGGKVTDCNGIPPSSGLSSSAKRIVKASDNTSSKAIGYVINYLEGGYFHPLHAWNSDGTFKSSYDYRTKDDPKAGNSGETLWGIDRPNGGHESSKDETIKKAGIAFWAEVDKKSGFGIYKAQNKTIKKYDWKVALYPKPSTYWAWLYNPGFTAGTILADNAKVIINNGFEKNMSSTSLGFGGHPLYKIVKNDGRLLFMYYRAWWNGPGWFQKFARNLKKVYDSGTTNVDKLICADLTFRYNAYSKKFWKNGISKMKDMIDFNP